MWSTERNAQALFSGMQTEESQKLTYPFYTNVSLTDKLHFEKKLPTV
jgi:hypothetical protein